MHGVCLDTSTMRFRWLAEFPDAAIALDHLKEEVTGDYQCTIRDLRDAMRVRRPQEAKQGEQL